MGCVIYEGLAIHYVEEVFLPNNFIWICIITIYVVDELWWSAVVFMPRVTGCIAVKEKFLSTIAKILKTGKDLTGSTYNYIYNTVKHCVNIFMVQNIVHI